MERRVRWLDAAFYATRGSVRIARLGELAVPSLLP